MKNIMLQFNKAILSLEEIILIGLSEKNEELFDLIIRDATIQRFEYVFEFTIKVIRVYIKNNYSKASSYDEFSFKDNIRVALQLHITTASLEDWICFRDARNKTSHTYSEAIAQEVYQSAKKFVNIAREAHNIIASKLND